MNASVSDSIECGESREHRERGERCMRVMEYARKRVSGVTPQPSRERGGREREGRKGQQLMLRSEKDSRRCCCAAGVERPDP
jgi:hypothetical protein